MGSKTRIEMPRERVAEFCRRHHIRRLSFFGSVISDHFTQDSDVDVLVEFEQGQVVGLLRLAGMEIELSEILGRKVDLRTPADLCRYFKDDVLSAAEVQYAEDCLFSS
jgi:predicted nucleotidyltransferase